MVSKRWHAPFIRRRFSRRMRRDFHSRATLRRTTLVCGMLFVLLLVVVVVASVIGSQHLPFVQSLCALSRAGDCGLSAEQKAILFDIRLPRILLAGAVGMCLASAGAAYQALLRNPLAEPYLLGVSNGAAVGTMIAIVFLSAMEWARPALAFTGAAASTFFVFRLAKGKSGATPERLVLAGVIVTTFLSSVIVFVTSIMDATRIRSFTFWLLGDLSSAAIGMLFIVVPVSALGAMLLLFAARPLNLMMLGERDAFDLGVNTGRVRLTVFLAASLLVGSSVAAGGSVGYVGLVVPHLIRFSLGADNRIVLPASAIGGALFVILADTIARTVIAPRELPVGAITALVGGPLFIYLLKR